MIHRRRFLRDSVILGATAFAAKHVVFDTIGSALASPYRAFSSTSQWNRPLPLNAPIDGSSPSFVKTLKSYDASTQYPKLAAGKWAEPTYWAKDGDPDYAISGLPVKVRIPKGAKPASTADAQLTVYDVGRGLVIKLQHASFDGTAWKAGNTSIYYLASNGLAKGVTGCNDTRNRGHRGTPPTTHAVRWDEIQAGSIQHALKVAIPHTAPKHVYPMSGDEGGSGSIPEGAVFRIKPSVDLAGRGLAGGALTIARAMQTYGVVIGDQSGQPMVLKLENLAAAGVSSTWSSVGVSSTSLAKIPFDDMECIQLGYVRS
jgi:hypothetical protein